MIDCSEALSHICFHGSLLGKWTGLKPMRLIADRRSESLQPWHSPSLSWGAGNLLDAINFKHSICPKWVGYPILGRQTCPHVLWVLWPWFEFKPQTWNSNMQWLQARQTRRSECFFIALGNLLSTFGNSKSSNFRLPAAFFMPHPIASWHIWMKSNLATFRCLVPMTWSRNRPLWSGPLFCAGQPGSAMKKRVPFYWLVSKYSDSVPIQLSPSPILYPSMDYVL